uniref:Predicted protein n=1 Tax=Hordeum vulgare subsp. vulgare TaxID=112509 RepID=F2EDI9_HORVV|nr:predicted protein [Hordeum vulgare subsp. vulgare]
MICSTSTDLQLLASAICNIHIDLHLPAPTLAAAGVVERSGAGELPVLQSVLM